MTINEAIKRCEDVETCIKELLKLDGELYFHLMAIMTYKKRRWLERLEEIT